MPFMTRGETSIYYEELGSGYPVLLYAPGSLESSIEQWRLPVAAFDPMEHFAGDFRLIAMDQRNAGKSWAPITENEGWHSYTEDHIALLDHLGIERVHLLGQCIGGPFSMALIQAQPERVSAAVFVAPSGRVGRFTGRAGGFDRWRETLRGHPEATPEALDRFRANLYRSDFLYTVPREFVPSCQVPILVLPGNDFTHPFEVAEELARLAPNSEFIPAWREGPALPSTLAKIREFLPAYVPSPQVTH